MTQVKLNHTVEGQWVTLPFDVVAEGLTKFAADKLARQLRKQGMLARCVKRARAFAVAVREDRERWTRKQDI